MSPKSVSRFPDSEKGTTFNEQGVNANEGMLDPSAYSPSGFCRRAVSQLPPDPSPHEIAPNFQKYVSGAQSDLPTGTLAVIRFAKNKYELDAYAKQILTVMYGVSNMNWDLRIFGYASWRGSRKYNMKLSKCRANAVAMYLECFERKNKAYAKNMVVLPQGELTQAFGEDKEWWAARCRKVTVELYYLPEKKKIIVAEDVEEVAKEYADMLEDKQAVWPLDAKAVYQWLKQSGDSRNEDFVKARTEDFKRVIRFLLNDQKLKAFTKQLSMEIGGKPERMFAAFRRDIIRDGMLKVYLFFRLLTLTYTRRDTTSAVDSYAPVPKSLKLIWPTINGFCAGTPLGGKM
jgi:outer membrane protein OmpA-like peptidoglycan-associated protein